MKKKLFFKLFIFAVIGALVTVTSCKDYDDDISGLNEEIAAAKSSLQSAVNELNTLKTQIAAKADQSAVSQAVATAKTEAINAALANATELLNTLKGGYTGTLKELNDKIVAQAALITVLQGNVTTLGTDLDAAEVQIAANKAAIALQKAILDKYFNTASPDDIPTALAAIKADLAAANVDIDALSDRIDAIDTALNVLDFNVNSMITEISFDYLGDDYDYRDNGDFDLNFTTTSAQINHVFATGVTNAVTFVKGQRLATEGVTIMVKVSPANADLSKMVDKIKLIRSDANAQINNYVVATKAERAKPMLTRATPTVTGLWNITFNLPISANLTELGKLVNAAAPATSNLFALAIENTVDEAEDAEDRFVISDFAIAITAAPVTPIYNLTFDAKNSTDAAWTAHTAIRNRYGVTDPVSATLLTDKVWSPTPWVTTSTAVADASDDRSALTIDLLNVEVAKEFNVRLSPTPNNVYGYYVTLDKDYAVESIPSEINAWNAYQYEGLNTLYKADEVAKIKINSASAAGDIIGFRVVAVNWDGTLVDPDGKSFYVGVGASLSSTLAFKQTITAPLTAGTPVASDILAFASPAGVAVASAEFSMALEHSQTLTTANLVQYSATSGVATTTDWAATKRLQITGAIPANLKENTAYTATLTLKNAAGIPVFVQNITLTKVLPTADLGITYKTSIHHDVAGQQVIYGYPLPSKYYDVTTALNVPAAMTDLAVTNNSTYAAASLPTWNQAATPVNFGNTASIVPVAEIGVPYLPAAAPGHGKIYDLTLSRNYGPVKYSATVPAGANYLLNWNGTPALKVEFRSFVQDLSDWKYTNAGTVVEGNVPVLKYGTALTGYALANITALPPAGARIGLTNVAPFGLQDGRTYTITDINVLTGANFTVVNEYFEPVPGAGSTINFNPVITSVPAANVPSKLEVTLTDSFGHAYTFVVPKVFDMTPN